MKKWLPFVTFALAAAVVTAQETTPPKQEPAPPKEGAAPAQQRQFSGEVVTADVATKTLTVKATGVDASGQRVEKTLALAVADNVAPQLETLMAGDKVTVLWQRDEAAQRDVILGISKAPPASESGKP
jgi:hypothetical protein